MEKIPLHDYIDTRTNEKYHYWRGFRAASLLFICILFTLAVMLTLSLN